VCFGTFPSRPYGFSKVQALWDKASMSGARLRATSSAASQASLRLSTFALTGEC